MAGSLAVQAGAAVAKSKTGRRLLLVVALVIAVPVAVVALPLELVFMAVGAGLGTPGGSTLCLGGEVHVPAGKSVAGFDGAQLKIAATIMRVGQAMGIDSHGQQIAVMVAIGESSLQNLDHGDAVDNTTIGVFQQGASYGPREDRMNVSTASVAFYDRMVGVSGWKTIDPGAVGHAVELGPPASFYDRHWGAAGQIIHALGGGAGSCTVPANAAAAAAELVAAIHSGKLTFLESRYQQQVIDMANGTASPDCQIDVHVLQIMVVAVNNFDQVGVSDLNRRCTGTTPGAGKASKHWQGKAVDFYALNHRELHGWDPLSIRLIRVLDPIVPHGSGLGQSTCRADHGDSLTDLQNFTVQFWDRCNHQHVQVP